MPAHSLDFDYGDKTIQEFVLLFNNGVLNLGRVVKLSAV
ncbi:MAG: hypothetical protein OJF47_002135 [Nitrospira sp.]|jgi:hypothetical protein|nr:MAG: hypothetical protein OJF47_002135 [Nitrospira sp.]